MSDTYFIENLKYVFEFGAEFVCKKCKQKNKVMQKKPI